jgi:hypothetical protein
MFRLSFFSSLVHDFWVRSKNKENLLIFGVSISRLEMLKRTMLVGRDQKTWTHQEVFLRLMQMHLVQKLLQKLLQH